MNKRQFLRSLGQVYTRLGAGKHGIGVFAIRPIPKGVDPFKNCDPFGGVLTVTERELALSRAPQAVKKMVRDFCALQEGVYYVPDYGIDAIDKSYYLNHSDTPNVATRDGGEAFIAVRNIRKSEELTVDYASYHDAKRWKKGPSAQKRS